MRHSPGFDSATVAEIDSTAEVATTAPLLGTLCDLVKLKKESQFTEYFLLRCWLLLWLLGFLTWLLTNPSQSLPHTGKLVDKKQFSALGLEERLQPFHASVYGYAARRGSYDSSARKSTSSLAAFSQP